MQERQEQIKLIFTKILRTD